MGFCFPLTCGCVCPMGHWQVILLLWRWYTISSRNQFVDLKYSVNSVCGLPNLSKVMEVYDNDIKSGPD